MGRSADDRRTEREDVPPPSTRCPYGCTCPRHHPHGSKDDRDHGWRWPKETENGCER